MKHNHTKLAICLVVNILILSSCAPNKQTMQEQNIAPTDSSIGTTPEICENAPLDYQYQQLYISSDKWTGLETRNYDEDGAIIGRYVINHPEGTPDPQPEAQEKVGGVKGEWFICHTENKQYPIDQTDEIKISIIYRSSNDPDSLPYVTLHDLVNVERWNGNNWERLIYVPSDVYLTRSRFRDRIQIGENQSRSLFLSCVVTKLTAGKYRAVCYINYEPFYVEFELTE